MLLWIKLSANLPLPPFSPYLSLPLLPSLPQQEQNIKPQYFTFRWLTLLLSQEFLLPDVIRIWDSLFSDQDRFNFLILVCCAMLTSVPHQSGHGSQSAVQSVHSSQVHIPTTTTLSLRHHSFRGTCVSE